MSGGDGEGVCATGRTSRQGGGPAHRGRGKHFPFSAFLRKASPMTPLRLFLLLALPLGAGGCVVTVPVPETVYSQCHAIGSSDWAGRVERIPDHHNRRGKELMLLA